MLPAFAIMWNSFMPFTTQPSIDSAKLWTFEHYDTAFSAEQTGRSVINSLGLSVGSATVIVLFGAVLAWITIRSRIRGAVILEHLSATALVFPGVVVGISLIWVYLTLPVNIYGTIWILFIAYLTRYLPFGLRFASSSMVQMHVELEEASLTSGATALQSFRRVMLPLIWPGLAAGWLYIVVVSMSELSSAVFLWEPTQLGARGRHVRLLVQRRLRPGLRARQPADRRAGPAHGRLRADQQEGGGDHVGRLRTR